MGRKALPHKHTEKIKELTNYNTIDDYQKRILDGALINTELRRSLVLQMRLDGMTLDQIHEITGVNLITIAKDIKELLLEYHALTMDNVAALVAQENLTVDKLLAVFLPRALRGNEKSAQIVLNAMKHRADVNGLTRPVEKPVENNAVIQVIHVDNWRSSDYNQEQPSLPAGSIEIIETGEKSA